ncbi:N-acetylmuramic acid 6-phosphate etherase [Striga asiatica]|uniref:N-acetylmuramic acid 6-phosphate etherase n=1 Tax=Striga asiatica TaxID=4170 RepID=A0A5A7R1J3_STRAF|nr:N-acetylmuramic acid 6-phosphate etherase [Striga asiatica]
MGGNTRFELTSASPETSYHDGQRGYSTLTLDISTSFRESADNKNVASGKANSRGSVYISGDVTTLSQCLMLEPIAINDQKHARSGDLRKVLGFSAGSNSEDNSFGAAHLKNSSPGAVEELKRLRASAADTCVKASGRAKKLDDHLNKLNKYVEAVSSKKQQQRNEMLTNERSSGSTLKTGSMMHRNTAEFGNLMFDERPKNGGLNKRLRTSVVETRAECRAGGASRQPMAPTRERDMLKDNNADFDTVEGKIRRLPAGGEGWDKKMKRKRSVGVVFSRSIDNDGELKRTMHHKLPGESSLQCDSAPSIRPSASGSNNKLDPVSSPAGSSALDSSSRMGNREDINAICPSPILKGKASRAPRSGSMVSDISASNIPRVSVTLESWKQPQAVHKTSTIGGDNNQKRSMPAGSSSPPITQWVGQWPQKISRTRRTNLIPVSSHDDVQMQSEGCSPSDFSPRFSSGTSATLPTKGSASGNLNFKSRSENDPSPIRLSESEESGAGEIRIKEKGLGSGDGEEKDANAAQNVGPSAIPVKKNKLMVKEESVDGVRRQGCSGRVSPFSRTSPSPAIEKMDNEGTTKPQRNARSSEKDGSKSGRPLKKLSDRKGYSRLVHIANGGSPSGSGKPWHISFFSFSLCMFCLPMFVRSFIEIIRNLFDQMARFLAKFSTADYAHEDIAAPDSFNFGGYRSIKSEIGSENSLDRMGYIEQLETSPPYGCSEREKRYDVLPPLYQRVLTALIVEYEIEESEDTGNAHIIFSCNGSADYDRSHNTQNRFGNGELLQREGGYVHSEVEVLVRLSTCDYVFQSLQTSNCGISSYECQYEQMCVEEKLVHELQSVGLYLEAVPTLNDKEDEAINEEIVQLEKGLHEQMGKKKPCLNAICKAVQEGRNIIGRDLEQIAMDKLVELAYKKLLATKRSFASKHGISKVSKQVALTFAKRTLTRYRKFEMDSRTSCFSDPTLRDIIFNAPPRFDETEMLTGAGQTLANDAFDVPVHQSNEAFAENGPITNRAKRKELSLDDVGGAGFRASSAMSGERRAKSKPKQKNAEPLTSANGFSNKSSEFANLPLNDIDAIDELGVDSEIGEPQDLNSWFNFDVEGLQDHDSVGLEIPMDDLAELNMF